MRRRLTLLSTFVALLLIFVLPAATVSAATFTYQVKRDTCQAAGGDYGYGHIYFKVRLNEFGRSGANKFTFGAKIQHRNMGASRWVTEYKYSTYVYTFPNNSEDYWATRWWSYDPADFAWHRIKVTLKVWHGNTLLASRTIKGDDC